MSKHLVDIDDALDTFEVIETDTSHLRSPA